MKTRKTVLFLLLATNVAAAHDYTLTVTPTNTIVGQRVTISWQAPSSADTTGDWVGFFPLGCPINVTNLATVSGHSGSFTELCTHPADYGIQLYNESGVGLTPPVALHITTGLYSLSVTPTNPFVGQTVTITWKAPANTSTKDDRVGYYRAADPSDITRFVTIHGTNGAGSFTELCHTIGTYYVQYYSPTGIPLASPVLVQIITGPEAYCVTPEQCTVKQGCQIAVDFKSAADLYITGDTVGYYIDGQTNKLIASAAVNGSHQGTFYFNVYTVGPITFGYFKNGSPSAVVSQAKVKIAPAPFRITITAPCNNATLTLAWNGFMNNTYSIYQSSDLSTPLSQWELVAQGPGVNGKMQTAVKKTDPRFFIIKETAP